jgi:hypothetical protein
MGKTFARLMATTLASATPPAAAAGARTVDHPGIAEAHRKFVTVRRFGSFRGAGGEGARRQAGIGSGVGPGCWCSSLFMSCDARFVCVCLRLFLSFSTLSE